MRARRMLTNCRSCGASAPPGGSNVVFNCTYCGTKNADEAYFIAYAARVDVVKAGRLLAMALGSYRSGDFAVAEQHLTASLAEDDSGADAWIYFALCKAATATPSRFADNLAAAREYLARAERIDESAELVKLGSAAVADRFLQESIETAEYFFETAEKKFMAYGEDRSAGIAAFEEAQQGFWVMLSAFELAPVDARTIAAAGSRALVQCLALERMHAPVDRLAELKQAFVVPLRLLRAVNASAVQDEFARYPRWHAALNKILQDPVAVGAVKVESTGPSSGEGASWTRIAAWGFGILVVLSLVRNC